MSPPSTFFTFSILNKHFNFQISKFSNFLKFSNIQIFQIHLIYSLFPISCSRTVKKKKKEKTWYKSQNLNLRDFLLLPRKNFCKTDRRFQRSKEFSRSLSKHMCGDIIARVTSTSFIRTIRTFRGIEERQIHEHAPSVFSRRIPVRSSCSIQNRRRQRYRLE